MTIDIPVRAIKVDRRHRTDMGDLEGLAASIRTQGLLQPIGVTEDQELVFGERRLRACRDILGWDSIPSRIVDVTSIVEAEHDENEVRKDFTPSERVAIGRAIEGTMAERRGGDTSNGEQRNPQNIAEWKGEETREIAAKKAGFGNRETYRQARSVVERGVPELVEKMDSGEFSISAAAEIAKMPPTSQGVAMEQRKLGRALDKLDKAKAFAAEVAAMPKPERPPSPEDRELEAKLMNASEAGAFGTIEDVVCTILQFDDPSAVAQRVRGDVRVIAGVDEGMADIRSAARWLDAFCDAWEGREVTHVAA